jgi:hypothetical protein
VHHSICVTSCVEPAISCVKNLALEAGFCAVLMFVHTLFYAGL